MRRVVVAMRQGHFADGGGAAEVPENPAAAGHERISALGLDYFIITDEVTTAR